jgi:hypothetical protein
MAPKLILMFTHNDVTVPDAKEYFEMVRDLDVDYYGFKEIGLPEKKMKELCESIQSIGKEAFIEVVEYDEDKILEPTRQAVRLGFDYLMGTVFFPSVLDIIEGSDIKYLPFCGEIYDRPSILDGSIEEIVADAVRIEGEGVDGFDLLVYRYKYPEKVDQLVSSLVKSVKVPIVSAGSINSFERLQDTIDQGVWGFTIGGAFFERKFVPGGSYRDNIAAVVKFLKELK